MNKIYRIALDSVYFSDFKHYSGSFAFSFYLQPPPNEMPRNRLRNKRREYETEKERIA